VHLPLPLLGSTVLTGLALVSATLLRRKDVRGWWLTGFEQPAWVLYAVWTGQYGFVVSAVWYFVESVKGVRTWGNSRGGVAAAVVVLSLRRQRVADAVEYLTKVDADTPPEVVEHAVLVYAFLRRVAEDGGAVLVRQPGARVSERVRFL
jgi:hypothetical protein